MDRRSLLVWLDLLKGLNPSAQHVGFGKVSITGCPALSKANPEFQDSWISRGMLSTAVTVQCQAFGKTGLKNMFQFVWVLYG